MHRPHYIPCNRPVYQSKTQLHTILENFLVSVISPISMYSDEKTQLAMAYFTCIDCKLDYFLTISVAICCLPVREKKYGQMQTSLDPTFWGIFNRCYSELQTQFLGTSWNVSYLNSCWFELCYNHQPITWLISCSLDLTVPWRFLNIQRRAFQSQMVSSKDFIAFEWHLWMGKLDHWQFKAKSVISYLPTLV
jgi:hypothetical protein